ncbi:MAG: anti-sigma factor family protein [Candidatus Binataceae bacterium]
MECRQYRSKFLTPHADGQLSPREHRTAEQHVAMCAACRACLTDERALKAMVRGHAGIIKASAAIRADIRVMLADASPAYSDRPSSIHSRLRYSRSQTPGSIEATRGSVRRGWRSPTKWAQTVGAVAVVLIVALFAIPMARTGHSPKSRAVTEFDLAISKYRIFEYSFYPNVPDSTDAVNGPYFATVVSKDNVIPVSEEFDDIAQSYRDGKMPGTLFDFEGAGFQLAGGRLDHLPDGRPVTYTLYQGGGGTILSICFRDAKLAAPPDAQQWFGTHAFYQYKGYSICLTFYPTGHFVSILVAQTPLPEFVRDVAYAEQ